MKYQLAADESGGVQHQRQRRGKSFTEEQQQGQRNRASGEGRGRSTWDWGTARPDVVSARSVYHDEASLVDGELEQ